MHFVTCPKQGLEMEAVVLDRVGFLEYFCPKQGQDFKPSAAPLYPNMGQVSPPPPRGLNSGLGSKMSQAWGECRKYCHCRIIMEVMIDILLLKN